MLDPTEATLAQLREALAGGRLTALGLTRWYLNRIDRCNDELRAVIEVNPDAEAEAARLDAGPVKGPLHGVPVLLKDNLDTADRMHTTSGSTVMLGSRPSRDATVVARLRAAGAVLLGKANKTSWILGPAGWSARGGQTRNPYDTDRSPHGSSSGSAVGVAANLCAVALGTETIGSILGPAAANCLVGVKPTTGLTSRAGMIPGIPSFDSIGPLTRTVADAADVLSVIAGPDPLDRATHSAPTLDYRRFLDAEGLRGARIGVPRTVFFGYSEAADMVTEAALEAMSRAGAVIVEGTDIPSAERLAADPALGVVAMHETAHALGRYLTRTPGDHPRTIAALVAANRENAAVELEHFEQDVLEMLAAFAPDLDDPGYREALATVRRLAGAEGIDAVMDEHRLDALVMPTCPPPWPIDMVEGDPEPHGAALAPGLAGYPAISVPAGWTGGLPLGITFTGRALSEPALFRLAHAFERMWPSRRPPARPVNHTPR
ncbi:amidase family protein [Streptomyces sp. NPDC051677]|uniref:amidase family protein n=1 Tax=Streptomyces sp. NPDC051677 TaxID=3365669 RepID=UPI0037CE9C0A